MKLGSISITLVAVALVAASASAGVVGSAHDLSATGGTIASNATRVCVFCHTPHQGTTESGQYPLWNHTMSTQGPYSAYGDPGGTINADDLTDIPVAVLPTASVSNLCLSCHDGTVSVISMYNQPNEGTPTLVPIAGRIDASGFIISNANVGTSLVDDHPVNFTYDTQTVNDDTELETVANVQAAGLLDGADKVQCSSCHDPHNDTLQPTAFMAVDNTNSALCTSCHLK